MTRPYLGAKDLSKITNLVEVSNPTGYIDGDTSVCELPAMLAGSESESSSNIRLWEDSNGNLVGFGQLLVFDTPDTVDGWLIFFTHPQVSGDGLESEILDWAKRRMRWLGRQQELPAVLHTEMRDDTLSRQAWVERQGFRRDRTFVTMKHDTPNTVESRPMPEGFTLRSLSKTDADLQAGVDLFNYSFRDHWNHHDIDKETLQQWLSNPHNQSDLNLIAVSAEGAFAALGYGYINPEENNRTGENVGWIKWLGTRRNFRRRGLGKTMLLATMRQLYSKGVEAVKLSVDADSSTKAMSLYESVGFQPLETWISYTNNL
jgi:GNAT superfamily N-acetyltransferase